MTHNKHLFIFGFGYSAAAFAKELMADGWKISATSRDPERRKEMVRLGIKTFDFDDNALIPALHEAQYLLDSVPPAKQGHPTLTRYGEEIARSDWQWIGHLSTTGVYGNYDGDWVDENAELKANTGRLIRRIDTELAWLKLFKTHSHPVHIFRLAGIYGPGRGPFKKLKQGTAQRIDKPGQFFSRIHVRDIAETLLTSLKNPSAGAIYNVCDDEPAPAHEVIAEAARLLGMEPPPLIPFEEAELSDMAKEFYSDDRKVSNRKIREELGVKLHYPTYREGVASLLPEPAAVA
jgi:nucleoside-diphosphate-sugar epimerase